MRCDPTPAPPTRRALAAIAIALLFGTFMATASAAPAYTIGPPSPALVCIGASRAASATIEANLQPADGAQVSAGMPATFSTRASFPVTFVVTSTPTLSPPYLDSAPVTPGAGGIVSFLSSNATAASGTIYWALSFSTSSLPECSGLAAETVTTKTRSLTVFPVPAVAPPPAVSQPAPAPAPAPAPMCTVPNLRGLSLSRVRTLLKRADCRLGRVRHVAHAAASNTVVTKQSPASGSKRTAGTVVNVTLGPKHRHR